MATIRITNLKLKTIIGINEWERKLPQEVTVNIQLEVDSRKSEESDDIKDTVDYKDMTKAIIEKVESSQYGLLEKLTKEILNISLGHPLVSEATVRIDKPNALRFSETVSVEMTLSKNKA